MVEGVVTDSFGMVAQYRRSSEKVTTIGQLAAQNFFTAGSIGIEVTCRPIAGVVIGGHVEHGIGDKGLTVGCASQVRGEKWAFSGSCNNGGGLSTQLAAAYAASERTTAAALVEFRLEGLASQCRIGIHRAFLGSGVSFSVSSMGIVNSLFQWNIKPGKLFSVSAVADHRRGFHTIGIGYNITTGEEE
jgi:hypothetical protein